MIRVKIAAIGYGIAIDSAKRNFSDAEWDKFSIGSRRCLIKRERDRLYDIATKAASLALKNELAPTVRAVEAGNLSTNCKGK